MRKTYFIHISLKTKEVVCNGTLLFAGNQDVKNTTGYLKTLSFQTKSLKND
jgi:hypothetical protein